MKAALPHLLAALLALPAAVTAADKPNVVLIYGDDVGWGDIGVQGSVKNPTPHLDKLAGQSLRFTDGHCTAATCTPSRFSMLTGIHGFRHNIRILAPNAPLTIPIDALTLPDVFKKAGYQTAIVGKWHLGLGKKGEPVDWNGEVKPGPLELGFDHSFLLPSTNDRVPCVYLLNHRVLNLDPADPLFVGAKKPDVDCTVYPDGRKNPEAMTYYRNTHGHNHSVINGIGRIGTQWGGKSALWDDETMTDTFVEKSKEWIENRDKEKPFFLFYSAQDIHVPRAPHPRFHGKSQTGFRGDAMVHFDWAVGELMEVLEEQGVADNTIVIFSSDNGPVYDDGYDDGTVVKTSTQEVDQGHDGSGPYRGGKYQIYEGGTRVPFLVRWPARIEPGVSEALVSQIDFLASFASLFEQEIPEGEAIDSRNTLPAFLGDDDKGLPYMVEEAKTLALREGPWKFILAGKPEKDELYHLTEDIGETTNVAAKHPDRATAMRKKLIAIREAKGGIRSLD
ncbi:arylsulfatase [Haloferula sp. A504]|uniref:arylsulfatase n=1 Tax=Haloferula sp. A504 TaxID=3373601 RepID=UPI0031CB8FB0|nr:arylsulfatase [Verrucomicrobiaceae bacterium E54]